MTCEVDVVVALDGEDAGAAMTPIVLNEPGANVVLVLGAVMAPMLADVEPPPRDCASATIVDETTAKVAATRGIS